jgi:YVTN family beta-propeller protein
LLSLKRTNRIASLAILPLMALAIVLGARAVGRNSKAEMPREGLLVVAQLRAESITTYDLETGSGTRQLGVSGPPHEFAFAAGRLYLTLGRGNALLELEPTRPGILRTLRLDGEPNGLAVDGDHLLVTLDKADALVIVDRTAFTETGRTGTGQTPHNVAVAGGTAYVTDSRDSRLRALPLAGDGQPLTTATGALPESVTVAGDFVVTADADSGTITIVRRDGFQSVGSMTLGGRPVRVITLDDTHVLVALNASSQVAVIDIARHHVERNVGVLGHPDGMCISPSGAYVAVVSNEEDAVQVFRRSDWALAGTLQTGDGPGACAWLSRH